MQKVTFKAMLKRLQTQNVTGTCLAELLPRRIIPSAERKRNLSIDFKIQIKWSKYVV